MVLHPGVWDSFWKPQISMRTFYLKLVKQCKSHLTNKLFIKKHDAKLGLHKWFSTGGIGPKSGSQAFPDQYLSYKTRPKAGKIDYYCIVLSYNSY